VSGFKCQGKTKKQFYVIQFLLYVKPLVSHKKIQTMRSVLILLLLRKLKDFGDMEISLSIPGAGDTCKTNLKKKNISRRERRERKEPKRKNYVP